ncbi:LemA family protein [Synergistaceae bacterium OttesenSCG-928-I11]|nr:LemA family protein [Synergistaceae bacterium OttesenSCG-928-I11]
MEKIQTLKSVGLVVLLLLMLIGIWAMRLFNRLVKFRTLSEEGWSGILAVLKRRRDLIPNLVALASGYMTHESETLEKITLARALGQAARSVDEMADAETSMTAALAGFRLVLENYPALKADANVMQIQEELSDLEERIEKVRRYYNATVRDYNMEMARFPANLIARPMGFRSAKFFDTDEQSQEVPEIDLSLSKHATPKKGGDTR